MQPAISGWRGSNHGGAPCSGHLHPCRGSLALIYDQPIVLNKRQVGVTLAGALGQKLIYLQHLAVDRHGLTHFAMALAKLLGFDLRLRRAGLSRRKLICPKV